MLFIESKSLDYAVDGRARTSLLESLHTQGFVPLIRSARLHLYETALSGAEHARDMESALAARADAEAEAPYVRGDILCVEDYAHFLLFGDAAGEGVRAGIVYESGTAEPLEKLDAFCRSVRESLDASRSVRGTVAPDAHGASSAGAPPVAFVAAEWETRPARVSESFRRFVAD
ncbi:MAG TPA: hypothetical protein VGA87_11255, partial [Pyrinomonadaceae bacterium]